MQSLQKKYDEFYMKRVLAQPEGKLNAPLTLDIRKTFYAIME